MDCPAFHSSNSKATMPFAFESEMRYNQVMTKTCKQCLLLKDIEDFPKDKSTKDGYTSKCKLCRNNYRKEWYQNNRETQIAKAKAWNSANPDKVALYERKRMGTVERRIYRWKLEYKLTDEQIQYALSVEACECCGRKERLVVDHCHSSMKFRGVICSQCNTALGMVNDNPDTLRTLIKYIETHQLN